MKRAEICVGCPGSGKSTYATELCRKDPSWVQVNRDDIRFSITGSRVWKDYKFNRQTEELVTSICHQTLAEAAVRGKNIIVSDTNLNEQARNKLIAILESHSYKVTIKEFDVAYEELLRRDAERTNGVGQQVIYRMYKNWLKYKSRARYHGNDGRHPAYIFDVDGTLAQMVGRKPYDWDRVGEDAVKLEVAAVAHALRYQKYSIIILSGRDGICEAATRKWLDDHNIPYDAFFMRAAGDTRKDTIIKEELFWEHIAGNYNVIGVFDDRPSVCRMWRELGLNVFHVGDPHEEF